MRIFSFFFWVWFITAVLIPSLQWMETNKLARSLSEALVLLFVFTGELNNTHRGVSGYWQRGEVHLATSKSRKVEFPPKNDLDLLHGQAPWRDGSESLADKSLGYICIAFALEALNSYRTSLVFSLFSTTIDVRSHMTAQRLTHVDYVTQTRDAISLCLLKAYVPLKRHIDIISLC